MAQNFTKKIKKNLLNESNYSIVKNATTGKANYEKKNPILQIEFGMELGGRNKRGKEEQKVGQKLSDMIKW